MQVSKWGNSLAIRLPVELVKGLGLKDGDEIEIRAKDGALEVERQPSTEEMFERVRQLRKKFPAGYTFKREDAYPVNRGGTDDETD